MKFAKSRTWRVLMSRLYGWGAAVVIAGALFKIMHWPYADFMLILGMGTEVLVFFLSGFEDVYEEPDWSLVYPELAGGEAVAGRRPAAGGAVTANLTLSNTLDKLLEDAKIGPELINDLGRGLRNLSENASRLADLSNAAVATNQYIQHIESASRSVVELNQTYQATADSLKQDLSLSREYGDKLRNAVQSMGEVSETYHQTAANSKYFSDQLQTSAQQLSALNAAYEIQLKSAGNQAENTEKMQRTINELADNIHKSVTNTQKYQAEMEQLTGNIRALNNVYGNMLSAMSMPTTR